MDVLRRIYDIIRVILIVFLAVEVIGAVYMVLHVNLYEPTLPPTVPTN